MSRPKLWRVTVRARARRGPGVEVVDRGQVVRGCQWLLLGSRDGWLLQGRLDGHGIG
jgi:hypothetical protein